MTPSLAVVIIATERRLPLLEQIIGSCWGADECVVVGDFCEEKATRMCEYYRVPAITKTTIDALMRRDVGWLVTSSDAVCFLSDDHRLGADFLHTYRRCYESDPSWDFLAPARYTVRDQRKIWLNVGESEGYVGGHAGIFRRQCAAALPWMAGPHHRNWDLLHSQHLRQRGYKLKYAGQDLAIEDIEPGATPWE